MEPKDFVKNGRILAIGRGANEEMIAQFKELTGKENPAICYLPTAIGDRPDMISWWQNLGPKLGFEPLVQKLFISTFDQDKDFEEVLLQVDAVYVGGGNTVNMLAIWAVHGIDRILRKALDQGIVLGGGSAGGICWFEHGLTDSRPRLLTPMEAMGWLPGSFAPHYLSEPGRRAYFHQYISQGSLSDGYGCDEPVGLYFENGSLVTAFGSTPDAKAFYVRKEGDRIVEEPLVITPI